MFSGLFSTRVSTAERDVSELLERGVAEVIPKEDLRKDLLSGRKLRVKLGIDPTSPNLHLGRSVTLLKLRDFQKLGHQVVLIIGDFTGIIGDTSDKQSERPMLSAEVVRENLKTYREQAGKILDMSRVEMRHNSAWLSKLSYGEIGAQADCFSVADFIARENIKKRLDSGTRVSLREVLYPLMQGYDSVAVKADVEIGGTDQRFNLLSGRTMQAYYKQKPQKVLTTELLPGTDGRKMSSSWGNTINLTDSPLDMYGKVMRVEDALLRVYYTLTTRVPLREVEEICDQTSSVGLYPLEAKRRLAREIVSMYHGTSIAKEAEQSFKEAFSAGGMPAEAPVISASKGQMLGEILKAHSLVSSLSEFRRLVEEGAVEEVGGERQTDFRCVLERTIDLRVGKRRFVRIEVV